VQGVAVDVTYPGGIVAAHQQRLGAALADQVQGVGLIGEKAVAAGLEAEAVDVDRAHGASELPLTLEQHDLGLGPAALDVEGGREATDTPTDHRDAHDRHSCTD